MKIKTLIELLSLSSSIYYVAHDSQLLERLKVMSEKGVENINKTFSESEYDENGNEIEFMEKIIHKTKEAKEEIEERIEELVIQFYKKINLAHLDEIKALNEKVEKSDMKVALLEARLNKLESIK